MASSAIDIFGANVDNFKNKLINGNFDFWQRGHGVSGSYTENVSISNSVPESLYLADRWFRGVASSGGPVFTFTADRQSFSQVDFGPNGLKIKSRPSYYMSYQSSFAAGNTGQYAGIGQRIENVNHLANKQAALSFWAKGSVNGVVSARISQSFGSTGPALSPQFDIGQRVITLGTSWQRYSMTYDLPDVSGATFGTNNDDYLEVFFHTYCSTNFLGLTGTINAGNTIDYAGVVSLAEVQLEEGSHSTFFDTRFAGTEYAMCQRYFEHGVIDQSFRASGSANAIDVPFNVPKKNYKYDFDSYGFIPVSGNTMSGGVNDIVYEDSYNIIHSIAGLTGTVGVPTVGNENLNISTSIITNVTPSKFTIRYDTSAGTVGQVYLRGLWAVDAEL